MAPASCSKPPPPANTRSSKSPAPAPRPAVPRTTSRTFTSPSARAVFMWTALAASPSARRFSSAASPRPTGFTTSAWIYSARRRMCRGRPAATCWTWTAPSRTSRATAFSWTRRSPARLTRCITRMEPSVRSPGRDSSRTSASNTFSENQITSAAPPTRCTAGRSFNLIKRSTAGRATLTRSISDTRAST